MLSALGALLTEGTYAMGKRFSLSTFLNEIRSYKATHTNVLGAIFSLLWRQPPKEDDARNPLKVMRATPWQPDVDSFEKRFGLKLITAFGATETGIPCVSPFEEKIRPGTCGKPLKPYQVKIFDDHDLECPPRSHG